MRFLTLTVQNFGVFRERHEFDLAPASTPDNALRPLTVISGHNGAGKSTLFQALALALHGSRALGDRVSQQDYNDFLLTHLHRHSGENRPVISESGSVTLDFQYVRSGQPLRIQISRYWRRNGTSVKETLALNQDGQKPGIPPANYQTWMNSLVPPGLAPLCFLDTEQLSALATPEQHDQALQEILKRLLGLDLVERLRSDLQHYTRKRNSGGRVEHLRSQVLEHQAALDKLNIQLVETDAKSKLLDAEQGELENELARQEERLVAEGGSYAARRQLFQQRLATLQKEIEALATELRNLSAGLLPFALAPELCRALNERLDREATIRRQEIAEQAWQERLAHFEAALESDEPWRDLDIPTAKRSILAQRLVNLLRAPQTSHDTQAGDEPSIVHHLSAPERAEIQGWISQALHVVPQQIQKLGEQMRVLTSERQEIKTNLSRAPDDQVLAPIHHKIMELEQALSDLEERRRDLDKQRGALEFQKEEAARQLLRMSERLAEAQANEQQLALAERSKQVLEVYQDALTRQRLDALATRLVRAFNAICRKEHLLAAAHIAPHDWQVHMESADGHALTINDFSAGERQLYAMALLWALRQVSGRQLPLAVDAPLARLDQVHRQRLIRDYVPAVSEQVLLLATDAELKNGMLAQAKPYLARLYRLNYNPQQEQTKVTREET